MSNKKLKRTLSRSKVNQSAILHEKSTARVASAPKLLFSKYISNFGRLKLTPLICSLSIKKTKISQMSNIVKAVLLLTNLVAATAPDLLVKKLSEIIECAHQSPVSLPSQHNKFVVPPHCFR